MSDQNVTGSRYSQRCNSRTLALVGTEARKNDQGEVVSVEEYLSMALVEFDQALAAAREMRDQLALRLHALQMASDKRVGRAVDDYQERLAEGRPYEDARSVETLIAEARSCR